MFKQRAFKNSILKIAILADIHGNHFALEKVIEKAKNEKIEQLLILGDFVGYYYWVDTKTTIMMS